MDNNDLLAQLTRTLLVLEKGCEQMYKMTMEHHQRLDRLEKMVIALEKKLSEKDYPR